MGIGKSLFLLKFKKFFYGRVLVHFPVMQPILLRPLYNTTRSKSEQVIVDVVKNDKIVNEAKTKLFTKSKVAAGGFLVNGANKKFTSSPLELANML